MIHFLSFVHTHDAIGHCQINIHPPKKNKLLEYNLL